MRCPYCKGEMIKVGKAFMCKRCGKRLIRSESLKVKILVSTPLRGNRLLNIK